MRSKILVVDDDENILHAFHDLLTKEGFQEIPARNGTKALQKFVEDPAAGAPGSQGGFEVTFGGIDHLHRRDQRDLDPHGPSAGPPITSSGSG